MAAKPVLLVLAAGIGSRYGGLKQIDRVGPSGETLMDYSIYDALRAGFGKVLFVIRREIKEEFHEVIGSRISRRIETDYVFQELDMVPEGIRYSTNRIKPWGTAHAVLVAREKIREPFVVINADDFYGAGSYRLTADYLNGSSANAYSMVGFRLDQTLSDYGHVARGLCQTTGDNYLASISEITRIERKGEHIVFPGEKDQELFLSGEEVVSMNIWGFQPSVFNFLEIRFRKFIGREADNPKAEFYIPTLVNQLLELGQATVKILNSTDAWFGVTYRDDKPEVMQKIRKLVDQRVYPESLW